MNRAQLAARAEARQHEPYEALRAEIARRHAGFSDRLKVIAEFALIMTDDERRELMKEQTNIFRVLVKTLLNAGIITDRTRAFYAMYVDLDELKAEGDRMVGDDIAEDGIRYLQAINFKDKAKPISIAAE